MDFIRKTAFCFIILAFAGSLSSMEKDDDAQTTLPTKEGDFSKNGGVMPSLVHTIVLENESESVDFVTFNQSSKLAFSGGKKGWVVDCDACKGLADGNEIKVTYIGKEDNRVPICIELASKPLLFRFVDDERVAALLPCYYNGYFYWTINRNKLFEFSILEPKEQEKDILSAVVYSKEILVQNDSNNIFIRFLHERKKIILNSLERINNIALDPQGKLLAVANQKGIVSVLPLKYQDRGNYNKNWDIDKSHCIEFELFKSDKEKKADKKIYFDFNSSGNLLAIKCKYKDGGECIFIADLARKKFRRIFNNPHASISNKARPSAPIKFSADGSLLYARVKDSNNYEELVCFSGIQDPEEHMSKIPIIVGNSENPLDCFDVSNQGLLAVGSKNLVNIYTMQRQSLDTDCFLFFLSGDSEEDIHEGCALLSENNGKIDSNDQKLSNEDPKTENKLDTQTLQEEVIARKSKINFSTRVADCFNKIGHIIKKRPLITAGLAVLGTTAACVAGYYAYNKMKVKKPCIKRYSKYLPFW